MAMAAADIERLIKERFPDALVSIDDLALLEEIENRIDVEISGRRLSSETVVYEDVRRKAGLV